MPNYKKTAIFLILCIISISILYWCQSTDKTENNSSTDQTVTQNNWQQTQKLVINNWCIWCGKCTIIAWDNFTMKWWIAVVTSQDNLDNQTVTNAVKRCPVSVIKII